MKAKDLRERTREDLLELEKSLAKDIFHARFKNFTARLDDTSSIRKNRRDLARVKTILHQQALLAAAPAAAPTAPAKAKTPKKTAPKSSEAKAKKKSEAK